MILTIEKRVELSATDFYCVDENGISLRVDIFTDGSLEQQGVLETYEGRKIEVESVTPYISIAHDIRLLEEN